MHDLVAGSLDCARDNKPEERRDGARSAFVGVDVLEHRLDIVAILQATFLFPAVKSSA